MSEPAREIATHNILASVALCWGEYSRAEAHAERVIELLGDDHARARGDGLVFPAVSAPGVLAAARAEQGQFESAIQIGEEAVRIAESLSHPHSLVQALAYLAYVHQRRGGHAEIEALCRRGLTLADRVVGVALEMPLLRALRGHALICSGSVEEGLKSIREAIQAHTAFGVRVTLSMLVLLLGEGLLVAGRLDEAATETERGMALAAGCGEGRGEASGHQLLGDIATRRDDPPVELAETHYQRALAAAVGLGVRPVVAHCHLGLGTLYRRMGRRQEAQEHLASAAGMYREMGMTYWLGRAGPELRELL